jgi:hypothetical protein
VVRPVASSGKTDLNKQGLNSVPEGVVKNNLKGISPQMDKKGWVDAQGRKGKVRSCAAWRQGQAAAAGALAVTGAAQGRLQGGGRRAMHHQPTSVWSCHSRAAAAAKHAQSLTTLLHALLHTP